MINLSVIIPTIGRNNELFNTLNDLDRQRLDKSKWECIVVLQTENIIERFREKANKFDFILKVFYSNEPNASLARNIGLLEAKGQIVLFLDDDLIIENEDFLEQHLKWYNKNDVSGVFGQVLSTNRIIKESRHKLSYNTRSGWIFFPSNYFESCLVRNGGAGNLSVYRNKALEIGGMDVNFIKGAYREESDFCLRYTDKFGLLAFDPKCSVIHIGAKSGGCRTWGQNHGIQKKHHIIGEWYFILRDLRNGNIKFSEIHFHLLALFLRQIFNPLNRKHLYVMPLALVKSIFYFNYALILAIKKPKTLLHYKNYSYNLVYSNLNENLY